MPRGSTSSPKERACCLISGQSFIVVHDQKDLRSFLPQASACMGYCRIEVHAVSFNHDILLTIIGKPMPTFSLLLLESTVGGVLKA
jgi:hypothetical protein